MHYHYWTELTWTRWLRLPRFSCKCGAKLPR